MFNSEELFTRLSNVSHFKGLPNSGLQEIVDAGQLLRFQQGEVIFHEGLSCSGLFVLFKGIVHLHKLGVQGQETIVAVIKPVIMFNEVTVIDGGKNPVTGLAIEDCVTWQIGYKDFQSLMDRYPQVGTGLLHSLATRNRMMLSHIEDISSRPILARVAKSLLDLSNQGREPVNRYLHSNQEIAARVATVHEAVSRSIKTLQDRGSIRSSRDTIKVISVKRLAELAQLDPLEFKG